MGVAARKIQEVEKAPKLPRYRHWLRALRWHQWSKNLLLFMPAVLAHRLSEPGIAAAAVWGFVAFSLVASAVYLLNDLRDLESDRRHPHKRHRPIAAGLVSRREAWAAAAAAVFVGFAVTWRLPFAFFGMLALYVATSVAYNYAFKKMAVLDVVTLACLYALRVFAGSAATGVPVSHWLMLFSLFLFFSLAVMKRVTELGLVGVDHGARDYERGDRDLLVMFGVTSAYLSVLVLALYLNADHVTQLYPYPKFLWAAVVVHLAWLTRLWLATHRGKMHSDPVVHALKDPQSYLALVLLVLIFFLAS